MRIALLIATTGRPDIVSTALRAWRTQTRSLEHLVVSIVDGEASYIDVEPDVRVVRGAKGSCRQRNTGLDALAGLADVVIVADDDFLPSCRFVEQVEALMSRHSHIAVATGRVLADGVGGAGLTQQDAKGLLDAYDAGECSQALQIRPTLGAYGCNMIINTRLTEPVRFDERLPLYGWQEDVDFSRRCRGFGEVVWTNAFAGVHLGVKNGRTPGVKFGYSQVINPLYLVAKGTMPLAYAARLVIKNVVANTIRSFRPEPFIDRVGRLKGNGLALLDLLRARLQPERVVKVT